MAKSDNCGCDGGTQTEAPAPVVLDSVTVCNDGALSGSGGTQGACSWHGGVSKS